MAAPIPGTAAWYQSRATPIPKPKALPGSSAWGQAAEYGWTGSPDPNVVTRATQNQYSSPYAGGGGLGAGYQAAERTGRMVSPDYWGILGSFTADARARFGAGKVANEAQRLSRAKGLINKLGVRDVGSLLGKVQQYGLTQADLQGAADNPWSELKGLDFQRDRAWKNAVAQSAAQGIYRSGASVGARQDVDRQHALGEAEITQNTLADLSEGQFAQQEWERQQRDQMEQAIAAQQASLAAAYQPYWQYD